MRASVDDERNIFSQLFSTRRFIRIELSYIKVKLNLYQMPFNSKNKRAADTKQFYYHVQLHLHQKMLHMNEGREI